MIDSKGFSPVRCRLKPYIGQSVAATALAPTVSPNAASTMSKAPRRFAGVRDRALDVTGSDEFFMWRLYRCAYRKVKHHLKICPRANQSPEEHSA